MARIARPPVIVVMGHIDHGKSTLLDYIRKTNVTAEEAGGITQRVSAYVAEHDGRTVTFLDTPGHEAFKTLRTRGAAAADIAILVVAADEGVMPQTLDALAAITEAKIPYIVALTKIDKNNADIERAKTSLLEHGVFLEGLGGDIPYTPLSSKTGEGVPELLDLVLLAADLAGLTADPEQDATGFVLESTQDPKRGASATLIIKDGTLSLKKLVVAGDAYAPVRFIENFLGKRIQKAGPSEPVQISGFNTLPPAGTLFSLVSTKKEAEKLVQESAARVRMTHAAEAPLDALVLPLIVKADTVGSVDAIIHELQAIPTERIAARVVASGVGSVSENDVKTAIATGALIIAFSTQTDTAARDLAEREHIVIESSSIIYELVEKIAHTLKERTPSRRIEQELGRAKVLKLFSSNARKQVLGVRFVSGIFTDGAQIKILHGEEERGRGAITNLQQARADVKEIRTEGDFGIEIEARTDANAGDELIAFAAVDI